MGAGQSALEIDASGQPYVNHGQTPLHRRTGLIVIGTAMVACLFVAAALYVSHTLAPQGPNDDARNAESAGAPTEERVVSVQGMRGTATEHVRQLGATSPAKGCPGSAAWIHNAKCDMTVTFPGTPCSGVMAEIQARANGKGGWYDPHNRGQYAVIAQDGNVLRMKRLTGDKKYTDLMDLTFVDSNSACTVHACSESQVTSYIDFSTNFCNLHDLYCGTKATPPCKYALYDFQTYTEDFKDCSQNDATKCIKV